MKGKKKRGNCYVTCEALYHLLGGKDAGWVAKTLKHEGDTHWYLEKWSSLWGTWTEESHAVVRVDPTVSQFKVEPDYSQGRARGFLTKKPSRRAQKLMNIMVWQQK
jgi:hypothetical protein